MRCAQLIKKLEELSPKQFAEDWDNVGLLVGDKKKNIRSVYIALDATDEAIEEAAELGVDMLISHHPMIFKGLKNVTRDHFIGRRVMNLIENDMCYYAMHTNFDVMGMADAAADELQMKNCQVLSTTFEDDISTEGFGRVGQMPEIMSLRECAEWVKQCFALSTVKIFGDPAKQIVLAAICPGSGKSMIDDAIKAGADVYITGDIDHHDGIDAVARDLAIIDAGHYGIEKIFVPYMQEYIKRELPEVTVYTQEDKEPFWYL